jgi:hypothetical protein
MWPITDGLTIWSCLDEEAYHHMRPKHLNMQAVLTCNPVSATIRRGDDNLLPKEIPIFSKECVREMIPNELRMKYSITYAIALTATLGVNSVHVYGCDMAGADYCTGRTRHENEESDNSGKTRWDKERKQTAGVVRYLRNFCNITVTKGDTNAEWIA